MRLIAIPGVFRPRSDSLLLVEHLREELAPGAAVADICSGSGVLAVSAAVAGAGSVTAVDISRRAVLATSINARLNGVRVRALRGSLLDPLAGQRFDLIVSNPPYVPADRADLPARGPARAWDAGRDGRALLDPICAAAPAHLRAGGTLMLVHSSVSDTERTIELLTAGGLAADVAARVEGPFGPLLDARAARLERRGQIETGARTEELVIVRGRAPASAELDRHGRAGTTPAVS